MHRLGPKDSITFTVCDGVIIYLSVSHIIHSFYSGSLRFCFKYKTGKFNPTFTLRYNCREILVVEIATANLQMLNSAKY